MTPADLEKAGHKLYGRKKWKTHLAEALGVNVATIFRMMHREGVTGPYIIAIQSLLEKKAALDELNKAANRLLRDRERLKKATRKKNAAKKKKLIPYAGSPDLEPEA